MTTHIQAMFNRFLTLALILALLPLLAFSSMSKSGATPLPDGDLLVGGLDRSYSISSSNIEGDGSGADTFPSYQAPSQLLDGNTTANYEDGDVLTKHFVAGNIDITFDFFQLGGVQISGLQMVTGDDSDNRDPVSWNLKGSNDDGDTWTLIDSTTADLTPPTGRQTEYDETRFDPSIRFSKIKFAVTKVLGQIGDPAYIGSQLSTLRLFSPQAAQEFSSENSYQQLMTTKTCSKISADPSSNGSEPLWRFQALHNLQINEVMLSMPLDVGASEEIFGGQVKIYLDNTGMPAWRSPIAIFQRNATTEEVKANPGGNVSYFSVNEDLSPNTDGLALVEDSFFWVQTLDPTCNTNNPLMSQTYAKLNTSKFTIEVHRINDLQNEDPSGVTVDDYAPAIGIFGALLNTPFLNISTSMVEDGGGGGSIDSSPRRIASDTEPYIVAFSPNEVSFISKIVVDGVELSESDLAVDIAQGHHTFASIERNHSVVVFFSHNLLPQLEMPTASGISLSNSYNPTRVNFEFHSGATANRVIKIVDLTHQENPPLELSQVNIMDLGDYNWRAFLYGLLPSTQYAVSVKAASSNLANKLDSDYSEVQTITTPSAPTITTVSTSRSTDGDLLNLSGPNLALYTQEANKVQFTCQDCTGTEFDGQDKNFYLNSLNFDYEPGDKITYLFAPDFFTDGYEIYLDHEFGISIFFDDVEILTDKTILFSSTSGASDMANLPTPTDSREIVVSAPYPGPPQDSSIESVTAQMDFREMGETITVKGDFPTVITNISINDKTLLLSDWKYSPTEILISYPVTVSSVLRVQIWNGRSPLLMEKAVVIIEALKQEQVIEPIEVPKVEVKEPALVDTTLKKVKRTIFCYKGKALKKVTAYKPVCPKGYKAKPRQPSA